MTRTNDAFAALIAQADAANDTEELNATIQHLEDTMEAGFVEQDDRALPFAPGVEMTDAFRDAYIEESGGPEGAFGNTIGGIAIDAANALARARRRAQYRLKTLFGFSGLRLVEEGDSWTNYPILLEDIGDVLQQRKDIAVFSLGAAGDLISNMAAKKEYLSALDKTDAPALLLSGGGNDMFSHLKDILTDYSDDASPEDLVQNAVFQPILRAVLDGYETILTDVAHRFPGVTVFTHGYDLPYPREDGKWMGPAMAHRGIPFRMGRDVMKVILDRFNEALADMQDRHPNMIFCDLRGKVSRGHSSWFDELHPRDPGYARAAEEIEETIRATLEGALETGGAEWAEAAPAARTIVIDPGHGGTASVGGSSWNNAVGPRGTLEKALTLDVATRAKAVLEDRGFTVALTRSTDVNLGLADRAGIAKAMGAGAFLSLHFNGSTNHNAQGTETFVHSSLPDGPALSKALCRAVQSEMVAALGLRDRNRGFELGAKRAGFGVLRPTRHAMHTAAILHEVSFMDRSDEEARLLTVSYRRKIATALADGIETFLSGIAGAETMAIAEAELGDAIELSAAESSINAVAAGMFDGSEKADGTWVDTDRPTASNGNMLDADAPQDDLLYRLGKSEAERAHLAAEEPRAPQGDGEGNEPSDYDPAVERAFGAVSTDVSANVALLTPLFGGAESTGFNHAAFEAFIQGLGLRYFSASEFLVLGGQNNSGPCAGKNYLPPSSLWPNIANTAQMIDEIRHRLNAPVYITSGYRSPAYNSCIGGAAASQHMRFNALDWYCTSHSRAYWRQTAEAVRASDMSRFNGFIDDYVNGNFVHIDTRHA